MSLRLVSAGATAVALTVSTPLFARDQVRPPAATPQRDARPADRRATAVIRGRVTSASSLGPLRRARITLRALDIGDDDQRTTGTNADGRFEFRDLPAGRYRVSVARGGYLPLDYGQRPGELFRPVQVGEGETVEKIDVALPRTGLIAGQVTDELGEPIDGVAVFPMRLIFFEGRRKLVPVGNAGITDDTGQYRVFRVPPGNYIVMASAKDTWPVVENGKETVSGYMPTYYSGVSTASEARPVNVAIGDSVIGIDFLLVAGRAFTVSGTAVDSKGRPFTTVSLREDIRGPSFGSSRVGPSASVAPGGSFKFPNVPPGDYLVAASRSAIDEPLGQPEVALAAVHVETADVANLKLIGSTGGTITGRIVAEGGSMPRTSSIRVSIGEPPGNQPNPVLHDAFRNGGSAMLKDDGSFTAQHVFGRARFHVATPDGWTLKGVLHNGRDISDTPIELKSGETMSGVEVVVTNKIARIGGQLVDDKGAPIRDATVLVFAGNAQRWFEGSRHVRAARPDQQGNWEIKGLPPGEYLAIAIDYVEAGAWNDPEYLESLRAASQNVSIAEGGTQTVALKVVPPK